MIWALAAANVLVLVWVELHGSPADRATLVRFGGLERSRVWSGEVWRLVTAAFLHAGWLHLASNLLAGVPAGRLLERALGSLGLLVTYAASAIGASASSLLAEDRISVGASGAVFGLVGAALALHRRGTGSWRAFLRSRATRIVLFSIAAWTIVGGMLLPLDHPAHAGGFAMGAAAAWLLSRPERRAAPWVALGAALGAVVLAALWPRGTASAFEQAEIEREIATALREKDPSAAERWIARAEARRLAAEKVAVYRAYLRLHDGEFARAIQLARPLLESSRADIREEARKVVVDAARVLGYRHATGDGAPWNPVLGVLYLDEACALGDGESCKNARKVRGGARPRDP